jgi:hypothetical protein
MAAGEKVYAVLYLRPDGWWIAGVGWVDRKKALADSEDQLPSHVTRKASCGRGPRSRGGRLMRRETIDKAAERTLHDWAFKNAAEEDAALAEYKELSIPPEDPKENPRPQETWEFWDDINRRHPYPEAVDLNGGWWS